MQANLDYKHFSLLLDIHMMQQGTIELLIFSRWFFSGGTFSAGTRIYYIARTTVQETEEADFREANEMRSNKKIYEN